MTDEGMELDLEAIRKRCEAATPGPWRECADFLPMVEDSTGYRFAQVDDGQNREFIAAARADVPALLARIEKLEWDLEAAETETERLRTPASVAQPQGWRPPLDVVLGAVDAEEELEGLPTADQMLALVAEPIESLRAVVRVTKRNIRGRIASLYEAHVAPPTAGVVEREGNVMKEDGE